MQMFLHTLLQCLGRRWLRFSILDEITAGEKPSIKILSRSLIRSVSLPDLSKYGLNGAKFKISLTLNDFKEF